MSDYQPKYLPGISVPLTVGAGGWTGGQVVTTAGLVAGAAATDVAGIAAYDAPAGAIATVIRGGVHRLVATGTVTNGQEVECAAAGTVRTLAAGRSIGRAWSTATTGTSVDVALFNV